MSRAEREESASPTFQYCADLVRTLREARGWSQEEVGRRAGYTGAAISGLETLKQPPTEVMLAKLDEVFFDGIGALAKAGRYLAIDHLPSYFKGYALLEQKALSIASYEPMVIDGLFQTEDYARALLECGFPPHDEAEVERLVEARIERKSALYRKGALGLVELVLEESALRRQVGEPDVMHGQMLHLAELAERPNITVQVLPLRRGAKRQHAGLGGPMKVVETPDHVRVVYLEVQRKSLLIKKPDEVSELAQRYAMIRAQALSPDDSLELIQQVAEEWKQ
ncbi:helix-turn-helix transcriptional regulator [Streptomyces sp. TRM70308]|uniref:helix-turn-helix domain-containing protein n=1 Tax=Streptomyces sp. TRM70308 TaxID=3131932 RepID=UPI003D03B649